MDNGSMEQQVQAEAAVFDKKAWAKPVLAETSVVAVTEAGIFAPPNDAVSGFYQS